MIEMNSVTKTFRVRERESGVAASIKSLFFPKYRSFQAVDNISLKISEGELVGYIGQNGAGKSTTIKLLTGILTPDSGSIKIAGLDPSRDRKKNAYQIGVIFGQRTQLWWDLPVEESFLLIKSIYKISNRDYKNNLDHFIEILGMDDILKTPARKLSLGQRMKADLAASLLHNPKVLFLDEPTIGLDLLVKEKVRQFIREINEKNKVTILLTTHDVGDLEALAKRIILVDRGSVRYDGDQDKFYSILNSENNSNNNEDHSQKDLSTVIKTLYSQESI
ncbi:ABC transporter ATP-binding protein [Leptospira sp. GIMC2001]|uniref:ABC transporter ATP-binding protein n=1 Tax=Leptospira sp. GIMC2001 TaxID=1513297 RepID=UPI002349A380|nr:ATP-binding cassette domain-containing protein [Leptospira sp. GIMC2001]WCL48830.1 ATP-binding cassette domain-containing protein [Leptospira sp. GIMC2001]